MAAFEKLHFERPFYGARRMAIHFDISRKKAARLMRVLHLVPTYPKKRTSIPNPKDRKFPYLLKDVKPSYPNHIWSTDITYLPMSQGFMYLTAVIDWYSRRILSWRISNTMEVGFCIETVLEALETFGEPEFFNSDQGSQYTSSKFQELFVGRTTKVSMDGAGRWVDNVLIERFWWTLKYEDFHLKRYDTVAELEYGMMSFMKFYNFERPHSSLVNRTPAWVYVNGIVRPAESLSAD